MKSISYWNVNFHTNWRCTKASKWGSSFQIKSHWNVQVLGFHTFRGYSVTFLWFVIHFLDGSRHPKYCYVISNIIKEGYIFTKVFIKLNVLSVHTIISRSINRRTDRTSPNISGYFGTFRVLKQKNRSIDITFPNGNIRKFRKSNFIVAKVQESIYQITSLSDEHFKSFPIYVYG